jgi:hypothetical protein
LRASGQAPGFNGAAQLLIQLTGKILAAVDHDVKFHTDEAPETIWRARQITAVAGPAIVAYPKNPKLAPIPVGAAEGCDL